MFKKTHYLEKSLKDEIWQLFNSENINEFDKVVRCVELFEDELYICCEADEVISLFDAAKLLKDFNILQNDICKKMFLEEYIVEKLYSLEIKKIG